jgi:hypothetical protein
MFRAGSLEAAYDLLTTAELGATDQLHRARLDRLRGQILFARGHAREASVLLLDTARRLQAFDDRCARETYVEAFSVAIIVGRLAQQGGVTAVAGAARDARPGPQPPTAMDLLLDGLTTRFTKGYAAALPQLRRALAAFQTDADHNRDGLLGWPWLACPVAREPIPPDLWDDEAWHHLAVHAVDLARELGAVASLPVALSYRAGVHVLSGEFAQAPAPLEESDTLAEAAGIERPLDPRLLLAAWQGDHALTTQLVKTSAANATARGEGRALGLMSYVTAVLNNGPGHYQEALDGARRACVQEDLGFFGWALAEMIEAAARSDDPVVAAEALHELQDGAAAAGTEWALGLLARS